MTHRRPRQRRFHPRSMALGALAMLALAALLIAATRWRVSPTREAPGAAEAATSGGFTAAADRPADAPPSRDAAGELVVDDPEGRLLWASPTAGPAISREYLPPGVECLIHLRPAALLAHAEGPKLQAALGPWGGRAAGRLAALAPVEWTEIESVVIGLAVDDRGGPAASLCIELTRPMDLAELRRRWPGAEVREHGGQTYLAADGRVCFLPGDGAAPRRLVACPADDAPELIDAAGEPPLLRRELEQLADAADADRMASVLMSRGFLLATGGRWFADEGRAVGGGAGGPWGPLTRRRPVARSAPRRWQRRQFWPGGCRGRRRSWSRWSKRTAGRGMDETSSSGFRQ
ncbi:MAG TPA: hypothetical protein PKC18_03365 [Lacipirellulaceae bacterium]|nr:hypothetical protein [Lacipirellulaceae bacterium]